jgi:hypothetical protein
MDGQASDALGGPAGATLVGSRATFASDTSSIAVAAPAGVQGGDVLVAAWQIGGGGFVSTTGWTELGTGDSADGMGGGQSIWVGYHVLATTETDTTTWTFMSGPGQDPTVEVLAFRGQRSVQPIAPARTMSTAPTCSSDAGAGVFDGIPFVTTGVTVSLFVFGTDGSANTLPQLPGLVQEQAANGLAFYRAPNAVPGGTSVQGPQLDLNSCRSTSVLFAASLGVVAP